MNNKDIGGGLGSGVLTAFLWNWLFSTYLGAPEMPAEVAPAAGVAVWGIIKWIGVKLNEIF